MINKRLDYVDALRGFAALYVILFHIIYLPTQDLPYPTLLHPILEIGWSGVTLFFIVSAFTLCLTLDGRTKEKNWILKFYFRRAARILPLYYAWLFLEVGYSLVLNNLHSKPDLLSLSFFTYNFQPGKQEGIVWASWTLGVEMVFYLIFPFVFKIANTLKKALVLLVVSLIISYVHFKITNLIPDYKFNKGLFHQLPVFSVGMITYLVYKNYVVEIENKKKMCALFLSAFIILFFVSYSLNANYTNIIIYPLSVAYSFLLLGLSLVRIKPIVSKVTILLGTISYSLYLNHTRLILLLLSKFKAIQELNIPGGLKIFICFGITIIPLTIVSYFTYVMIEKPGGRFVKYLSDEFFRKTTREKLSTHALLKK